MVRPTNAPNPAPTIPWTRQPWLTPALGISAGILLAVSTLLTWLAPYDVQQGYLTRALPLHANTAWTAYLSFGITAVYGLAYLITRRLHFDRVAAASAEVGLVFIVFTLFSGAFWGKATWGTFWQWDARLTTTALLFVIYVGYLIVRGLIENPARRARVAASIGILASVGIPVNYMSVYWWRSLHQTPSLSLAEGRSHLSGNPQLSIALYVMMAAFTLFCLYLVRYRAQLAEVAARHEEQELEMSLRKA